MRCGTVARNHRSQVKGDDLAVRTLYIMNTHVKAVGILHIIYGLMLLGLAMTIFFGLGIAGTLAFSQGEQEAATLLGVLGTGLSGLFAFLSLPNIIGGWALLAGKGWGRILLIVMGFVHLIDIPIGTALGIYTIWALMRHYEVDTPSPQVVTPVHS